MPPRGQTDEAVGSALLDLLSSDPNFDVLGPVLDETPLLQHAAAADVVIVDLHVSAGEPTWISALRTRHPRLRIIGFSADESARERALAAGADRVAIKGDRQLDLVALIHDVAAP